MTSKPTEPFVLARLDFDIWDIELTEEPAGVRLFLADDKTGRAVVVNLSGYMTRPIDGDPDGNVTVHARVEEFARDIASYAGLPIPY